MTEQELIRFFECLDDANRVEKLILRCKQCTEQSGRGPCARHAKEIRRWVENVRKGFIE